jgi:hypothetical protein
MPTPHSLILVQTTTRRYVARTTDITTVRRVAPGDPQYLAFDLGELLDPEDTAPVSYGAALIVPLRRRSVALRVARVEELITAAECPLPPLVQGRLAQPWACGLVAIQGELVVRIDPRAVVRSAMLRQLSESMSQHTEK